jgi:hypothetical protein
MRRMPAGRRLSTLVKSGADVRDGLRTLAKQLAGFHAAACSDRQTAAEGTRDAVRDRWQDSFEPPAQSDMTPHCRDGDGSSGSPAAWPCLPGPGRPAWPPGRCPAPAS